MSSPDIAYAEGGDQLFESLAEHLKQPLLYISQHVELAKSGQDLSLGHVENLTDMAIYLIDGYLLSRRVAAGQISLNLEPVNVPAVLHESAEKLQKVSKEYSCRVDINLQGHCEPVLADRRNLQTAITALGYAFIESQSSRMENKDRRVVLGLHKSRGGIVTGIYGDNSLSKDMFRRAKSLVGRSGQGVPNFGHGATTGVFIADAILQNLSGGLFVSRHQKLKGLAATLTPNPQLRFSI